MPRFQGSPEVARGVPRPRTYLIQTAQMFQELLGLSQLREELFFLLKRRWMHHAPASAQLDRVTQVEHLVIDEIVNRIARHAGAVKDPADDDGVVRGIIVSQASQRAFAAPGHLWSRH